MNEPTPRTDTEITSTGAYTCIHHSDQQRAACPVCLVASLTAERDKLRAIFPQICNALGNGAFCTPTVSFGLIESIPNEVQAVVAKLRAEVERLKRDYEYDLATERARLGKMITLLTASNAKLALIFGELTAGESRTIRAVLKYVLSTH